MGQALLDPPTVKGYPGGRKWLNAATLLARRAFLLEALREGRKAGSVRPDLVLAAEKSGAAAFALLLGREPSPEETDVVAGGIPGGIPGHRVFDVVELLVLHPLFQRC
jgi:hypothetical protein